MSPWGSEPVSHVSVPGADVVVTVRLSQGPNVTVTVRPSQGPMWWPRSVRPRVRHGGHGPSVPETQYGGQGPETKQQTEVSPFGR